jgi:glycerol uptake facilitator-like aquaporin
LLVGLVLAICDAENMSVPKHLIPVLVGLVVGAVGMSFGFNCGFALNPPRDLGPRIFTSCAGWGAAPFRAPIQNINYGWFWVPILGPYLGAIVGALGYLLFVGNNWPRPVVQPAAIQA